MPAVTARPSPGHLVQSGAQLGITSPHTVSVSPHGIVVQSGSAQPTQASAAEQLEPAAQVPQETLAPQPLDTAPQVLVPQGLAVGTQHVLTSHASPVTHVSGQVIVPPQPLDTVPQARVVHAWETVSGVQQAPLSHTSPVGQVSGQVIVPPHPLGAVPQITPTHAAAGVLGVQHVPASQARPAAHVPQVTVAPHASFTVPQTAPSSWQSCPSWSTGWHSPPEQVSPVGQLPHSSRPPHSSLATPHVRPSALQVVVAQVSQR